MHEGIVALNARISYLDRTIEDARANIVSLEKGLQESRTGLKTLIVRREEVYFARDLLKGRVENNAEES